MSVKLIHEERVQFIANGLDKTVPLYKEIYMVDDIDTLWVNMNPRRFLDTEIREAVKATMAEFSGRKYMHKDYKAPDWWGREVHCYGFPLEARNEFLLTYRTGKNPYGPWESPLLDVQPRRDCLYNHQKLMFQFMVTRRYCVIAAEMGTGKSLAVMEFLEYLRDNEGLKNSQIWYVAPVVGVRAIKLELSKWKSPVRPGRIMTYDGLRKTMRLWEDGDEAPKVVVFDESSKLKTWKVKRTKAAFKLAEAIRLEHGDKGAVIEMSGTPAPKTPLDWWSQAEIACPGFLAEPSVEHFKSRLSIVEKREGMAGGSFSHTVTFLDDEKKCRACGQYEDHLNHQREYPSEILTKIPEVWPPKLKYGEDMPRLGKHTWEPSKNEVHILSQRLDGLAQVTYKRDCIDLPEKVYRVVRVKPTPDTIRAAKMIQKTAKSAAVCLIKLRELSDGFNYTMEATGDMIKCSICEGKGKVEGLMKEDIDGDSEINMMSNFAPNAHQMEGYMEAEVTCDACGGEGVVPQYRRAISEVECPKDDVLRDYLDEQEDAGRIVVWGAFTGSIERISTICKAQGWNVLRIEGKGWKVEMADPNEEAPDITTALKCMDASHPERAELMRQYEKFAVVGNPQAGGMGLTLTAAQVAIYYSNPFSGEARIQSEDRIHRTGMDKNKSPIIVDLVHLPSDKVVINNLKTKRRLQDMSMGELISQLDQAHEEVVTHDGKERETGAESG